MVPFKLATGVRVMLVANIYVSDSLVNGARGKVVHIVSNDNHMVTSVLIKFDNQQVGIKAIQASSYQATFPDAVPLGKHEVVFHAKRKHGSENHTPTICTDTSLGNHNTQSARPHT